MLHYEHRLSVAKTSCLLQCSYDAKNLKKRKVSVDEYTVRGKDSCIAWDMLSLSVTCLPFHKTCASPFAEDGTRFYDLKPGNGQTVGKDDQVTVHFDCMYKGIDVVSTRSARLLGGNRTVAEASGDAAHSQVFWGWSPCLSTPGCIRHAAEAICCVPVTRHLHASCAAL